MSTSVYAYANHHRSNRAFVALLLEVTLCEKGLEGFAGIQSFPVVKWQFDSCQKSVGSVVPQSSGLDALGLRPQRVAFSHLGDHSDGDCLR